MLDACLAVHSLSWSRSPCPSRPLSPRRHALSVVSWCSTVVGYGVLLPGQLAFGASLGLTLAVWSCSSWSAGVVPGQLVPRGVRVHRCAVQACGVVLLAVPVLPWGPCRRRVPHPVHVACLLYTPASSSSASCIHSSSSSRSRCRHVGLITSCCKVADRCCLPVRRSPAHLGSRRLPALRHQHRRLPGVRDSRPVLELDVVGDVMLMGAAWWSSSRCCWV